MTTIANRILQIVLVLLLLASLVMFIFFYLNGERMAETVLSWGQILLAITVALVIIFPIISFIRNPKSLLKFLGVIVLFAILCFISWLFSSGATEGDLYVEESITTSISRLIGTGMIMVYILAGIAVLSIIVTSIINAFK